MNEAATTVPLARNEIKLTTVDEARFWAKVNKDGPTMPHMESPCWLWTAATGSTGYGQFFIDGKAKNTRKAHRVVWTLFNGPIPHDGSAHGICVCHHCDNPACVNPEHLFLGTNADNVRDKTVKGRNNSPRGDKNGSRLHPEKLKRGEANGRAKLTATQVIEIRALYASGISQNSLSAQFEVARTLIQQIVQSKIWKHL
jgi:hypothetical protein